MKDAILVEQTLAGDHQAFNSLITDHYTDIYNMVLSWVKNSEDSKDLTQDVFISAYLDLPSLRDHKQFYLWLRQIAKHRCQNWKRGQVSIVPLDNDLISKEPSVDEVLIQRETLAEVMEAIDELPESERELLKEHYLDDMGYGELSARHRVSTSALATKIFRIRQKIRDQLGKTLSVFVAFLHDRSKDILTGGMEIMKLSIKTKLIAGGVAAIIILGGTGVLIDRYYMQNRLEQEITQISQENDSELSAKSVSVNEKSSENLGSLTKKKSAIANGKIQINNPKTTANQLETKEKANDNILSDSQENQTDKSSGSSVNENQELTPEVKQKVEIYSELASILPEFSRINNERAEIMHNENLTEEMMQRSEILDKRWVELVFNIRDTCISFLKPPAITQLDGETVLTNFDTVFTQISSYLGKELPFDGKTDYFLAEDYKGGTGGW